MSQNSGTCVPGASVVCACSNGQQGAQTCTSAGTYAACICAAPTPDAAAPDLPLAVVDAQAPDSTGAQVADTAPDAGSPDLLPASTVDTRPVDIAPCTFPSGACVYCDGPAPDYYPTATYPNGIVVTPSNSYTRYTATIGGRVCGTSSVAPAGFPGGPDNKSACTEVGMCTCGVESLACCTTGTACVDGSPSIEGGTCVCRAVIECPAVRAALAKCASVPAGLTYEFIMTSTSNPTCDYGLATALAYGCAP